MGGRGNQNSWQPRVHGGSRLKFCGWKTGACAMRLFSTHLWVPRDPYTNAGSNRKVCILSKLQTSTHTQGQCGSRGGLVVSIYYYLEVHHHGQGSPSTPACSWESPSPFLWNAGWWRISWAQNRSAAPVQQCKTKPGIWATSLSTVPTHNRARGGVRSQNTSAQAELHFLPASKSVLADP